MNYIRQGLIGRRTLAANAKAARTGILLLSSILLSWPAVSRAQQSATAQPATNTLPIVDLGADRITIGVGPAVIPSYVGSDRHVVVPGIAVQGEIGGHAFSTLGTSLSVDLISDDGRVGWKLQAGPSLAVRLDRTSAIHNPKVDALGKLRTAWEPGGWVGIQRTGLVTSPYDSLSLSISWQRDVARVYRGAVWSPTASYSTPLSLHDYVSVSAGADRVGRRFGNYYYDIDRSGSQASGLTSFDLAGRSAGWKDWNGGLLGEHMVAGTLIHGLGVVGSLNYARLLGRYARSPIVADVGSPRQWSYTAGVAYTF